jgi:hypothetical protein
MANTSFNFNIDPYYDDFESSGGAREQNYMRILFRPGKAVQARELTQIQSILQNQIKSFGDHIFKDGSPVQGGHLTLDANAKSVKLLPQYNNIDIDLTDFNGNLIKDTGTANVKAVVVAVDDSQVNPTLVVKYLTANEFTTSQNLQVANTTINATTTASDASASASTVSINEGIFYVDGYFVYVAAQTIVLDPYNRTPSYKVGLQIVDGIVNESTDSSLLDPAQESFNFQAPGATRYQFDLELTKRTLTSTDDSKFFELLRVENGIITKQIEYPVYSEIEKTLARRTYDESGDYTVKPFRVTVSENQSTANTFKVNVEPGKAYVKGYEFETFGTISLVNDKANTSATTKDYSFSLDYGSYVITSNVYSGGANGFFDIASYESVDLHTVPVASINTKSSAVYSNTKIGTARVRNIDLASGTDYYAYLVDINTAPKNITVTTVTANAQSVNLGSTFSALDDAYKGVNLRTVSGTGTDSYTRTITSYNGTTKIAVVDIPFATALDTSSPSIVSLVYNIKDCDSIVRAPTVFTSNMYVGQDATTPFLPSMDIAYNGKSVDGKAVLFDGNRGGVVYPLPETYVTASAFSDITYYKKKVFTSTSAVPSGSNVTFTLAATGNEKFFFGNGDLSSTTAKANFIVVNRFDGKTMDLGATPNLVSQVSDTSLTIRIKGTYASAQTADIIATLQVLDAGSSGKTLKGNTSNATLIVSDTYTTGAAVLSTSSGVYINKTKDAQVWFKSPSYIQKTPGVPQSLYVTDVIRLIKAFDSGNISWAPNSTNQIDITERYVLDGGQRDNYYDFATVTLRNGYAAPTGQTVFLLQCFEHSGSTYFNSASYSPYYTTNQIPNYATKNGVISLRDAVDFRPTRANSITTDPTTFALSTRDIPSPDFFFQATYNYYVPRIDKLVLTRDKEFKIVKGVASIAPVMPPNSDDGMTLYNLYIPPYTANVAEIGIEYVENKRYTMRDIGALEKRVENIEYYTSLNVLELQARNETILYEDNVLEKEKYGIVTDDFTDFTVADGTSADLVCNISKARLGPYRAQKPFKLDYQSVSGSISINDRTISLAYSQEACITQNTATKAITVQPYEFAQFYGSMKLFPETDYWYSTQLVPEVLTASTQISPHLERPPSPPEPTPAPEINPSANLVSAPVTVGLPNFWQNQINPVDGFGTIDINSNWFGAGLATPWIAPSVSNFDITFGSNIPGISGVSGGLSGINRLTGGTVAQV